MGGEGGTFPLLGVTPVGGTSKMEVFWGRWGTRGTLGAGVLILDVFLEHLRILFGSLGDPGKPILAIFSAPWAPFCSPGAASEAPRGKDLHLGCLEVSKSEVFAGCR